MSVRRILFPIDVARCPLELFTLVNGFAQRPDVTVILLHVVNLNLAAPDTRVYAELGQEALGYLQRLANQYVHPLAATLVHIRTGPLAEQILAEAKAEGVDLIILPTSGPSVWNQLRALWQPGSTPLVGPVAAKVIRQAECGVFVVVAKARFNCRRAWGRLVKPSHALPESAGPTVCATPAVNGWDWRRDKAFSR
jgi:nucleotide-binding universal stress UspA family protein